MIVGGSKEMKENLKQIRILAFDMDGTLLNERGILSPANEAAICRAMDKGYHVVLATGRSYCAFPQDVLAVKGIRYMISANGAHVIDHHSEQTVFSDLLKQEAVNRALPWIEDPTLMIEVMKDHKVYANKSCMDNLARYGVTSEKGVHYVLTTRQPIDDVLTLVRERADELENINLRFKDEDKHRRYWEELKKLPGLTVVSSIPKVLEIGSETASKANALKALAGLLGLGHDHIMAFGDSSNDAHMLEEAAVGVAMGNAAEDLKALADYVTRSNAKDGVAYALEELLGI